MNSPMHTIMAATLLAASVLAGGAAEVIRPDVGEPTRDRAHYQRPEDPPGRTAFLRLPVGVVRPEGWLRDWCEATRDGVLGHPYDYPPPECAQVYGKGWTGVDLPGSKGARGHGAHWPAEQCATWFEGAIKLGAILEDEALVNRIKERLLVVAENVQKAPEDSFLFYWWTSNAYPWSPKGTPNKPGYFDQYYSCGNLGTAMAAGYEVTGDRRILKAMETAYSRQWRERPDRGSVGSTNGEAILRAWAASGSPTLAKVARQLIENTNAGLEWHFKHHKGPRTGNLLGFENRTHTASFLYGRICSTRTSPWHDYTLKTIEANERIFRAVEQYYMLPSGAMQGDEVARGIGAYKGNESCTNMQVRWTADLLRIGGRGYYGDRSEECFFNFLPSCWTRDMQGYTYFSRLNNHAASNMQGQRYKPLHGTLCCPGQMAKAMASFVQNMWMATRDNGLAWTAYGPCAVRARAGDGDGIWVDLRSTTAYPFEETVALDVDPQEAATFPLLFRVPQWCEGFEVEVNGKPAAATPDKGFVTIRREWKHGDRVRLHLPMAPRVHVARELEGAPFAAVFYGPLHFGLPVEKDGRMDPDAQWKFALDAPEGAEAQWKLERRPMPEDWDWPLEAPLTLSVTAVEADWEPVLRKAHDVAEELKRRDNIVTYTQNDVTCLPADPFPDAEPTVIKLVPYGCTLYRVSMFPITSRTAPRIAVPNPDPALDAPLFIGESEFNKKVRESES